MKSRSKPNISTYFHVKFCCVSQRNAIIFYFSWSLRNLMMNVFLRFSNVLRLTYFVSLIKMDDFSYCGDIVIGK